MAEFRLDRGSGMIWSDHTSLEGTVLFLAGAIGGYWLFRWKERNLRAATAMKEQAVIDNAKREADALLRESRLAANEEALKQREQTEKLSAAQRRELSDLEQRLAQREALINAQLEGILAQEKSLREKQTELLGKQAELEAA